MKTLFDFLHNCVAHPLLFFTMNSKWANWFHDWTAEKAYGIGTEAESKLPILTKNKIQESNSDSNRLNEAEIDESYLSLEESHKKLDGG